VQGRELGSLPALTAAAGGLFGSRPRWARAPSAVVGTGVVDDYRHPSGLAFRALRGRLEPLAFTGKLKDDCMMHQAVDGGHGGHRIFEDLIPLAEH